jgi:hypothetical protein
MHTPSCICLFIHTRTQAVVCVLPKYIHMLLCTCEYILQTCIHACMFIHAYMHAHMHACMHTCMHMQGISSLFYVLITFLYTFIWYTYVQHMLVIHTNTYTIHTYIYRRNRSTLCHRRVSVTWGVLCSTCWWKVGAYFCVYVYKHVHICMWMYVNMYILTFSMPATRWDHTKFTCICAYIYTHT